MFESGRKRAVLHLEGRAAHRLAINSALTPADQRINGKHVCILISTCVETSMACSTESVISGGRSFVMRDAGIHATVRKRFVARELRQICSALSPRSIVPPSPERSLRFEWQIQKFAARFSFGIAEWQFRNFSRGPVSDHRRWISFADFAPVEYRRS